MVTTSSWTAGKWRWYCWPMYSLLEYAYRSADAVHWHWLTSLQPCMVQAFLWIGTLSMSTFINFASDFWIFPLFQIYYFRHPWSDKTGEHSWVLAESDFSVEVPITTTSGKVDGSLLSCPLPRHVSRRGGNSDRSWWRDTPILECF